MQLVLSVADRVCSACANAKPWNRERYIMILISWHLRTLRHASLGCYCLRMRHGVDARYEMSSDDDEGIRQLGLYELEPSFQH